MLDYFPNADHAPIYAAQAAGDFKEAGIDVEIRQPPDPAAPLKQLAAGRVDLAISYEPEVLRARDKGLNVVVGRRARAAAAHLDHLAAEGRDPHAGGPGGQDGRHGGDRLPGRLPAHDPARGRRHAVDGEGAQRGLRPQPGAADGQGRRHARRLLELRGRRPEAARAQAADHPRGQGRRPVLQRARAGGERGRPRARRRHDPGVHRGALARRARARARTRTRRSTGCSRPTRTWTRPSSAPRSRRRSRSSHRPRASRSPGRTPSSGTRSRPG